jgi:hypothetical protein
MVTQWMRWVLAGGSAAVLISLIPVDDCRSEVFRKRATLRTGLPSAAYGYDDVRFTASVTTSEAVEEQILLVLDNPTFVSISTPDGIPWQDSTKASADSILARPGFRPVVSVTTSNAGSRTTIKTKSSNELNKPAKTTTRQLSETESMTQSQLSLPGQQWNSQPDPVAQPVLVRRKSFAPKQPGITAEHVTLSRIGLAIYETGHITCTGMISQSGGPDGLVRGNDVTVRVRGYGINRLTSPTVPNGPLHFESRSSCRVMRGDSEAISLVPCECSETVRRHFDEIVHLEVILESRHSR